MFVPVAIALSILAAEPSSPPIPKTAEKVLNKKLISVCVSGEELRLRSDGTLTARHGKGAAQARLSGTWSVKKFGATEPTLWVVGDSETGTTKTRFAGGMTVTLVEALGPDNFKEIVQMDRELPPEHVLNLTGACPAAQDFEQLVKRGAVVVESADMAGLYVLDAASKPKR